MASGTTVTRQEDLGALVTVHGRVARVVRLVGDLLEVTLTGFPDYPALGGDEFVYTMVSAEPAGIRPDYGIDDVRRQDPGDPVRGAYYTIRRSRPDRGEIDLWVVAHGHPGSVGAWMAAARPGDPVALWGPRCGFVAPDDMRHLLLVADETGLAAVAALVEQLPVDQCATAVLECASPAHRPPMPAHPGLTIHWVDRGAAAPGRHDLLLQATKRVAAPDRVAVERGAVGVAFDAVFGAGESRRITRVRRYVRDVLGIPAERTLATGYWRTAPT